MVQNMAMFFKTMKLQYQEYSTLHFSYPKYKISIVTGRHVIADSRVWPT